MRDWNALVGDPLRVLDWCPVERSTPGYRAELWELHYPRWPEASTVTRTSGSWRQALLRAELPVDRPPLPLALQDRITAAHRMREQRLTHIEIAAELGVHAKVVGQYLRARLCDCGNNYVVIGERCNTCANRRGPTRDWTPEELTAAIQRWRDLEGRPPRSAEWQNGPHTSPRWRHEYPDWPALKDIQRQFGSWNQALRAAGIAPVHPIGVTTDEVITALKDAHAELGERLSYKTFTAWASKHRRPSTQSLVRHFGTFNEARKAAGIPNPRT